MSKKGKLIADHLLAMPALWDEREPVLKVVRSALKMPADNHGAMSNADQSLGMCDRFMITMDFYNTCYMPLVKDEESLRAIVAALKPPLPIYWMELEGTMARPGRTKDGDGFGLAWFFREGRLTSLFGLRDGESGYRQIVLPIGFTELGERTQDDEPCFQISRTRAGQRLTDDGLFTGDDILRSLVTGLEVMSLLASRRHVSTKRILPSASTAAERAFRRRRIQQGRPVFSYNKVDLVLPQTCIYRGEVRETSSFAGKRGHMVIGHWRLISGVAEPFFTWVDGHERGNRELGRLTKERTVSFKADSNRKGFAVPNAPGSPGERRRAAASGA